MGDGEWKMGDVRWERGRREMGNGKCEMGEGRWEMEKEKEEIKLFEYEEAYLFARIPVRSYTIPISTEYCHNLLQ